MSVQASMAPSIRARWAHALALVGACVALLAIATPSPSPASVASQLAYARGLAAFAESAWEEAYAHFDAAVAADPGDALALYYRGLTLARYGRHEMAASDIRSALHIEPLLPGAPLDLGIALFNLGRFADAQRPLEIALERPQERPAAAFFLGLSAYRLGDHATALRWLDQAADEPSVRQAALYYAGLARLRAGDTDGARYRLADAVAFDPDSEIGRRAAAIDVRAPEAELVGRAVPRALRPWSVYARTELQFDSNVNAGASSGPAGTRAESDVRPLLRAGGHYRVASGAFGSLTAAADLSQSVHFDVRDFDLTLLRLRLDWASRPQPVRYGAMMGYEYVGLDYGSFAQAFTVQPWLAYQWSEVTTSQLYYRFRYRDYIARPFDPFRDGFNNALGLRQYWAVGPGLLLHGGYQLEFESPEDTGNADAWIAAGARDFEYAGHQLDVGAAATLNLPYVGESVLRGGYRLRLDDYANGNSRSRPEIPFGKKRQDVHNVIALELAPRLDESAIGLGGVVDRLEFTLGLIAAFNSSNIDAFEHDRVIGTLGLRARF